ncbi:CDP-alcohol phosphatidyltransferase family protein [Flavobacterium croceum]|uniref:CDP-diacylglycerol--serine O-phosphatidyltransferase n=1 Tax=Flavobacterium croceum DSM 17960 TaxID=1121886 RepID=A0A2S4N9D4_9FLAO|nr:CDP-alcohol phosphatidyltransferase family protein [Flavobacterium croceum]POS02316.1 CDP-diacylglycerol--serine O-phosphatidyltransferase [Flavobacterium croceum DSM 17960]
MNIKKHIPNILTLLNLFCGCIALVFLTKGNFEAAFYSVCLGIFFDFFDGFFARKFNVSGPLGVQLDSLADMVTSGVVPGFMMYGVLSNPYVLGNSYWSYAGFAITVGSCYRLANFNIDTRQTDSFIGLPTPANSLFFMSLPFVFEKFKESIFSETFFNSYVLIALCFLSAYVMNAEIPLFSLKIKQFSFAKYKLQISFLLLSLVLLLLLKVVAVPIIIVLYVVLSVVNNMMNSKKLHG